jgi:hypothetical protein
LGLCSSGAACAGSSSASSWAAQACTPAATAHAPPSIVAATAAKADLRQARAIIRPHSAAYPEHPIRSENYVNSVVSGNVPGACPGESRA